ncbi:MAG: UMP kinase, partial [Candidatus Acidiferrales bacterium]
MTTENPASGSTKSQSRAVYQRIVLKLSGESLSGPLDSGIHAETIHGIAQEVKGVNDLGVQVAI